MERVPTMETDAAKRKATPIYTGFVAYFPDAIAEVARLSKAGNDQHNPGAPLHWDRSKSGDELDALMRHLVDNAEDESIEHLRAVAWRAMAKLQKACEKQNSIPQKIATPLCNCGSIGPGSRGHWHRETCPINTRYDDTSLGGRDQ